MIADRAWVLELTGSEGERGSLLRKQCGREDIDWVALRGSVSFRMAKQQKIKKQPEERKCVTNLVPSEVIEVKNNPRHLAD